MSANTWPQSCLTLTTVQPTIARENASIMSVICLIIGAKLIGDAISGLAS